MSKAAFSISPPGSPPHSRASPPLTPGHVTFDDSLKTPVKSLASPDAPVVNLPPSDTLPSTAAGGGNIWDKITLSPFTNQVGGHKAFLRLTENTVCKPLIASELRFYESMPQDLRPFTPLYLGIIYRSKGTLRYRGIYGGIVEKLVKMDTGVQSFPARGEASSSSFGKAKRNLSLTDLFSQSLALTPVPTAVSAGSTRHSSSAVGFGSVSPLAPIASTASSNVGAVRRSLHHPPSHHHHHNNMQQQPQQHNDDIFQLDEETELPPSAVHSDVSTATPHVSPLDAAGIDMNTPRFNVSSADLLAGPKLSSSSASSIATNSQTESSHNTLPVDILPKSPSKNDSINNDSSKDNTPVFVPYINPWSLHQQQNSSSEQLGSEYILLEDLTAYMRRPCILDLKMGTRQHGIYVSDSKRESQQAKVDGSTSALLGTRLCGMQLFRKSTNRYYFQDKYYGRSIKSRDEFHESIRQFVPAHMAKHIAALIAQLQRLYRSVDALEGYRFYASSLLLVYDGDIDDADSTHPMSSSDGFVVRMVDFANCLTRAEIKDFFTNRYNPNRTLSKQELDILILEREGDSFEGSDKGYLQGLDTLISIFQNLQKEYASGDPHESGDDTPSLVSGMAESGGTSGVTSVSGSTEHGFSREMEARKSLTFAMARESFNARSPT